MCRGNSRFLRNISFLAILFFVVEPVNGQTRTITGRIIDDITKEPVSDAAVIVMGTTDGTYSNALGYFQLEIEGNPDIAIDHINYGENQITIPGQPSFLIPLKKEYVVLPELKLGEFPKEIGEVTEPEPDTIIPLTGSSFKFVKEHAKFPGGIDQFYGYLGNALLKSNLPVATNPNPETSIAIKFVVDENGNTIFESTLGNDSTSSYEGVQPIFNELPSWTPAKQNQRTINQYFVLPILGKNYPGTGPQYFLHSKPFYDHINQNTEYPSVAIDLGIEGRVYVKFTIDSEGTISQTELIRGIGAGCDQVALQAVRSSPPWKWDEDSGDSQSINCIVPITFRLDKKEPKVVAGNIEGIIDRYDLYEFFNKSLKYPRAARQRNIQGRVFVQFAVAGNGQIAAVQTYNNPGGGIADEVKRAIESIPPYLFLPLLGEDPNNQFILPIAFGLQTPYDRKLRKVPTGGTLLEEIKVTAIGIRRQG